MLLLLLLLLLLLPLAQHTIQQWLLSAAYYPGNNCISVGCL
jgi:hypothetical protein